jgi:hypothetical protein
MPQAGGRLFKKGFRAAGPEARAVNVQCDAPAVGMDLFLFTGGQLGRTPMTEGIVALRNRQPDNNRISPVPYAD